MRVSRRRFMAGALAGTLGAGLGLGVPRRANAWGEIADPGVLGSLPAGGHKVLEIFLYGAVSLWEMFYVRNGIADPFFGMDAQVSDLDWSASCAGIPSPATQTQSFGNDALGAVLGTRNQAAVAHRHLQPRACGRAAPQPRAA